MDNYLRLFGKRPHNAHSPIVQGDHPELDTSDLLEDAGIQICQSLIGSLQWAIQNGRFDIATAVMTLSRFRACPRQGHLNHVNHVIGYLSKFKHSVIRIRTDKPDYFNIPKKEHDWFYTCYCTQVLVKVSQRTVRPPAATRLLPPPTLMLIYFMI